MSRLSAFLRRLTGNVRPILEMIQADVLPVVLKAYRGGSLKTDDDRRNFVTDVVKQLIDAKYPEYAWLTDRAVDFIVKSARLALEKRR